MTTDDRNRLLLAQEHVQTLLHKLSPLVMDATDARVERLLADAREQAADIAAALATETPDHAGGGRVSATAQMEFAWR